MDRASSGAGHAFIARLDTVMGCLGAKSVLDERRAQDRVGSSRSRYRFRSWVGPGYRRIMINNNPLRGQGVEETI